MTRPERLLVAAEAVAVLVVGVLLATAGYLLGRLCVALPVVASLLVLAPLTGVLVRLALEIPAGLRGFRAWHAQKTADLLASATRRRWATSTDLTPTGNGHDPYQ